MQFLYISYLIIPNDAKWENGMKTDQQYFL